MCNSRQGLHGGNCTELEIFAIRFDSSVDFLLMLIGYIYLCLVFFICSKFYIVEFWFIRADTAVSVVFNSLRMCIRKGATRARVLSRTKFKLGLNFVFTVWEIIFVSLSESNEYKRTLLLCGRLVIHAYCVLQLSDICECIFIWSICTRSYICFDLCVCACVCVCVRIE